MKILPLTNEQKRIWVEWKIEPNSFAYNLNLVFKLTGHLKIQHLKQALNCIIKKNETFRTYFSEENGKPFQIILSPSDNVFSEPPFYFLDVSFSPLQDQEIEKLIHQETHRIFDLRIPLLYRFFLIKVAADVHYFIFSAHHIVSDGVSLALFVQELTELYNNPSACQEYLEDAKETISDYIAYTNTKQGLEKQEIALEYWKNSMRGMESSIDFPSVAENSSDRNKNIRFIVEQDLLGEIKRLASVHHVTVFMVLITTFSVLMHRYFNKKNFVIGYAVNVRPKGMERLFGFYVNNIPLKIAIDSDQTFVQLLERVGEQRKNDRPYQELPLQEIVKFIRSENDNNGATPFNVSFNEVSFPVLGLQCQQGLHLTDLIVEPIAVDTDSHFDLSFLYAQVDKALGFSISYKSAFFKNWFIEQMAAHFLVVLRAIVQDPNRQIGCFPLLTKEEQRNVFCQLSGPKIDYCHNKTPAQILEANAEVFADKLAVICNERSISYGELNKRANQLAHFLLRQNVSTPPVLAIQLERSIELIVSIVAAMKAAYSYVPIDPNCPSERVKFILKDTNAAVFITDEQVSQKYSDYSGTIFSLKQDWSNLSELPTVNPNLLYNIYAAAYIVYTSGSTGFPKGVSISINSLMNLSFWHKDTYLIQPDCHASVMAGVGFDALVWEIWPYLISGATLHVADQETLLDNEKLAHWLIKEKVNIAFLPTPVAHIFLKKAQEYTFSDLRFVLTGGEQLKTFPPRGLSFRVFNHYGPTENTVVTTQTEVSPIVAANNTVMPSIGKPIANVDLYVLDNNQELVPAGVAGELYIGGIGLAQSYLNQPDLFKRSFVPSPFDPGKILYKTGDLVRWQLDGNLDFVCRVDNQIKLRGFRIELAEIESRLLQYPLIEQCVILVRSEPEKTDYLVAYFVAKEGNLEIDIKELKEYLSQFLPDYMLPVSYISINKIPLTLNGKIDKEKLLALDIKKLHRQDNVMPRTKTEEKLLQIWSEILGTKKISIFDNFFALGGHSLLISAVVLSVKKIFAVEIPFRSFFENSTIVHLAQLIDTASGSVSARPERVGDNDITLRRTIMLANDIQATSKPVAVNALQNLLITGATGFLGSFLLTDLYHATEANIYCLMRGTDLEEAKKRLRKNLIKYNLDQSIVNSKRIKIILGDLAKPQLGISQQIYDVLAEEVDSIYHSAAHVHHIYGYDVLEAENVFGTIEIIKLAVLKKHKHIHYISTISAATQNLDNEGSVVEDFLKYDPRQVNIIDGYNQTKLASELLLSSAQERGISVYIYRPSWIAGHSETGVCALENQHLFLLIKGCIQMGYAPHWDIDLNIVPIDFVSKFISYVSTNISVKERVFNLVNTKSINWLELINWVNKYGYKVSIISNIEWRKNYLPNVTRENALYPLVPLYIGGTTNQHTQKQIQGVKIKDAHTKEVSCNLGISCPEIDNNMLKRYFQFLHQAHFIQAPKRLIWYKKLMVAGGGE